MKDSRVPLLFSPLSFAALASLGSLASGCGGTTTGNPSIDASATEIAASSVSGAVNSTEPNGTQASYRAEPALLRLLDALSPVQASFAANPFCPTIRNATCSSGTMVMTYAGCSFGLTLAVWQGSQTLSFSGSCATINLASLSGQTLTRTFGTGTTETNALGIVTKIDTVTAASSGWDSTVTGIGEGEQAVFTGGTDGSRTLTILGVHLRGQSAAGSTLYDHTISSTGITVSGAGVGRSLSSGTITVQHNLARMTAKAQITTPLIYDMANCCHPSAGALTSTLSGSQSGTETLTFTGSTTGNCGTATLVNSAGVSSNVVLSHCF